MFLDKTSFWRVFGTSEYLLFDMFSLKIFAMRESTILADILTNFAEMQSVPVVFLSLRDLIFLCVRNLLSVNRRIFLEEKNL